MQAYLRNKGYGGHQTITIVKYQYIHSPKILKIREVSHTSPVGIQDMTVM